MFDFRYHLASLVAVIVMLGVGLLLGSAIADRGAIEKQRAALVSSLQRDVADARKTNDVLKGEVARNRDFAAANADALTKNALAGRTVAIIVNEGDNAGLASAETALRSAGAKVAVVRVPDPEFGLGGDPALMTSIGAVTGSTGTTAEVAVAAGKAIGAEWAGASGLGKGPVSEAFEAVGKLNLSGATAGAKVDGVVVLATFPEAGAPALMAIAQQAQAAGVAAAAAQTSDSKVDVVGPAAVAGLSTVDDIQAPAGGYSLVEILSGAAKGRYGTGTGVTAAFPPVTR